MLPPLLSGARAPSTLAGTGGAEEEEVAEVVGRGPVEAVTFFGLNLHCCGEGGCFGLLGGAMVAKLSID